ncbi:MAG: glycosyltransferase [Cyanobacteria bacterium P01_G01_bin.67]
MKIAIIASGFLPLIDGVTVSGLQRLKKLSQWGHQVILFCPDYSNLAADYPHWQDYTGDILPGVKIINLPSGSFVGIECEPNVTRSSYQIVLQKLAEFQPEVIHVDEPERLYVGFWQLAGVDYAKKAGIPYVSFFRTNFIDYFADYFPLPKPALTLTKYLLQQLIVWVYNSYDLTLVTSKITYPKVVDLGIKNAKYSSLVGFDRDRFTRDLAQADFFKSQYGLADVDRLVKIVFLGRLYPDKGWDFTLTAFKLLAQQVDLSKVAVIVAGDGPMRQQIAAELSQLTPNLHLLGRVSPENVPALLVNCDLHVTTSEKETRGLTALEAFAAGIPILAPNSGGIIENIQHGHNGFLYTPGDRQDFTNKLKTLIEDSNLRQAMGDRASGSVDQFSWDNAIQNLVNIWQEAIDQSTVNSQQSTRDSRQVSVISNK